MAGKIALTVFICVLAVAILMLISSAIYMSGKTVSTGRCAVSDSGEVAWISSDNVITVMHGKGPIFNGLSTGDEILIVHENQIALSYPGQVVVHLCIKKSDGSFSDIPKSVQDELIRIGFVKNGK